MCMWAEEAKRRAEELKKNAEEAAQKALSAQQAHAEAEKKAARAMAEQDLAVWPGKLPVSLSLARARVEREAPRASR